MENRAPKKKHCYIAEVFCSFSILVSSVTNAIHNEKQNAGIHNRKLLCFLIAWIVPSFGSIPWKKGNGRQESFLHIACTTGDGNCIMPAVSLRNESILAEGSDQYTEMIFILLCVILLCPFMQPNLTKAGESQWTYPWGWCHQTQFKAKAGAEVALLTLEGAFGCVPLPPIPTPTQAKGASICFIFRWSIFWDHKLEQMRLTGEMKA